MARGDSHVLGTLMQALLALFASKRRILETHGTLIIRQLIGVYGGGTHQADGMGNGHCAKR